MLRIEHYQEVDLSCISGLPGTACGAEERSGGTQQIAARLPYGPASLTLEVCTAEVQIQLTTGTEFTPPCSQCFT